VISCPSSRTKEWEDGDGDAGSVVSMSCGLRLGDWNGEDDGEESSDEEEWFEGE
jgi:hypothetical protein